MNIFNKFFLLIPLSLFLLGFSFYMTYDNTATNEKMLKYLQKDQIKLSYLANKLNQDIKLNQITIQHALIFNTRVDTKKLKKSLKTMSKVILRLRDFFQDETSLANLDEFENIMTTLEQRYTSYNTVSLSMGETLLMARNTKTKEKMQAFHDITNTFSRDIERLIDVINTDLYTNILNLKTKNTQNSQITIFSFLFALILISIALYKIISQGKEIKKELFRAEHAEKMQQKLQEKLLKYNEDLEKDISQKTKELHTKMYSHFLSGLPNRNKLLEDSELYDFSQVSLLNIDKFQKFNDVYGEEVGNVAIKLSADFLLKEVKSEDITLYHVGGDEFVYTKKRSENDDDDLFTHEIEGILSRYAKEVFEHNEQHFTFTMSAGIAFTGRKKILAYADMSLKDAKKRNVQLAIYCETKSLVKTHEDDIQCHKKLLHAFKTDSVLSHFQPIVPIQDDNKETRYESLVRIKDIDDNIIPPFNFIDVAIANRIYYKITNQVIKNTLEVVSQHKIPCSLNISMLDIGNEKTLSMLYETFTHFKYNNYLTVELLETEEIQDYQVVYDFCVKIRSFGIKIALDDFGSGYSSFAHIMNLPIDYIKIDASLISNIDRDTKAQIMVETIVSLAQKLNIQTIAEFVSSQEILNIVKKLKVDYAQGFYTGKPADISSHLITTTI